jgi:hypothetical protein
MPIRFAAFLLLASQTQADAQPAKEYIRLGGRVIAIESPVQVQVVAPARTRIGPGEELQFTVTQTSGLVTWSLIAGPGSITPAGLYKALGPISGQEIVTVRATSSSDPSATDDETLTVQPVAFPANASFSSAGGSATFEVTKLGPWTAVSGDPWVQITSGGSGDGNGQVGYQVSANQTAASRQTTIAVAGTTFGIIQSPSSATVSIYPDSAQFFSNGGSGSITVTVEGGELEWTAVAASAGNWITITSGAEPNTTSGAVNYTVAPNPTSEVRGGSITIAGRLFNITQYAPVSIVPVQAQYAFNGGSGTATVSAATGQGWTATVDPPAAASWISITAGSTGSGSGTVNYTVAASASTDSRTAKIRISGPAFNAVELTILQSGQPLQLEITPNYVYGLPPGAAYQFQALINGVVNNGAVTWTISPNSITYGSVNGNGLYVAPISIPAGGFTVIVRATSKTIPNLFDEAQVIVNSVTLPQNYYVSSSSGLFTGSVQAGQKMSYRGVISLPNVGNFNQFYYSPIEMLFTRHAPNPDGSPPSALQSCYLHWNLAGYGLPGFVYLRNDQSDGNVTPTPVAYYGANLCLWNPQQTDCTPMQTNTSTMTNSQCKFFFQGATAHLDDFTQSEASQIWMKYDLQFDAPAAGLYNVFIKNTNSGGVITEPWKHTGSWTVTANAPAVVSADPSSGSGASQLFTLTYSDVNGFADIQSVRALIHPAVQGANSCYLYYTRADNKLYLHDDPATALLGPVTPGALQTISNSQCTVNAAASSVVASGNNLVLNVALTFTPGFAGAKNVFGYATDMAGLSSPWIQLGTWTVP